MTDGNQPAEILQPSAPAPPPRPYDSLLPQLALGGLTWSGKNDKPGGNQETKSLAQENKPGNEEVWKEEKEEDEDLDEGGQQKGKVPIIVSGNDESSGHPQDLSVEMSSSGNDHEEMQKDGDTEKEMKASGDNKEQDDGKTEQNMALSGSGEANESNNLHLSMYINPESGQGENVRRIFPENDFSASGEAEQQETSDDNVASSSGSGQYQRDERLELTSFSGSGE